MQFNISNLSVYMDDIASMWSKDIRQKLRLKLGSIAGSKDKNAAPKLQYTQISKLFVHVRTFLQETHCTFG